MQELIIRKETTQYLLEQWETPEGKYLTAKLPGNIKNWHFGPTLRSHIVYQAHKNRVPQDKICEELQDKGIQISEGQINRILEKSTEKFVDEIYDVLEAGLQSSKVIATDDTGARHKAKNGYCTVIRNDFFTFFKSSDSKSKINFLEIVRGRRRDYFINQHSIDYIKQYKISKSNLRLMEGYKGTQFTDKAALEEFFKEYKIAGKVTQRILTESMLLGIVFEKNLINPKLILLSDGAPQFNLFSHALCWIHIERPLRKLVPTDDTEAKLIEQSQNDLWKFYQDLKSYKKAPSGKQKKLLPKRFDEIFNQQTESLQLNEVLKNIFEKKSMLLKVLECPIVPLHNNGSENDIREYVIRRKISGGTRSQSGRESRDMFSSFIKTCTKLRISSWEFVNDRIAENNLVPYLPHIIRKKSLLFSGP